jgi:hypothetical protein
LNDKKDASSGCDFCLSFKLEGKKRQAEAGGQKQEGGGKEHSEECEGLENKKKGQRVAALAA